MIFTESTTVLNKKLSSLFISFMVRHHFQFIWIMLKNWIYGLLYKMHLISEVKFQKLYWSFFKKGIVTQKDINSFSEMIKARKQNALLKSEIIVDQVPQFLLVSVFPQNTTEFSGLPIDMNGEVKGTLSRLAERLTQAKITGGNVSPQFYRWYLKGTHQLAITIVDKNQLYRSHSAFILGYLKNDLINLGVLFASSMIFGAMLTVLASYKFNAKMTIAVLLSSKFWFYNSLPIFLLAALSYFIFNRTGWALFVGALPFSILALVNFFMLKYRNFPLKYSDLKLASEAKNMGSRYSYVPSIKVVMLLVAILIGCFLVGLIFKKSASGFLHRLLGSIIVLLAITSSFKSVYFNSMIVGEKPIIYGDPWNAANRYATNGFIYSFLNSISDKDLPEPANYSEKKAKKVLSQYSDTAIPKSKKVNVIMIQLEAFNDFSKWDQIKIDPTVYAGLKAVQKESIHGNLTTTIFGGGTVDTERKSITGYSKLANFNNNRNSFVRYFNGQGYQTLALHPGHGWFYNRQNVEKYLGFNKFYYFENYYSKNVDNTSRIIPDDKVFNDLYKHFKTTTDKGKYLFNQTISYQNHGPYSTEFSGSPLVEWQEGYNKEDYAIINNYLTGIKKTSDELLKLINEFQNEDPTIIAFWGDHNPWGGNNNSTYKMLGINLDLSSQDGYSNYYDTPYCIWANTAAKKRLNTDFVGQGANISPMYLLPTIFEQAGWTGNQWMQELQAMKTTIPVFGENKYLYQGKFVGSLPTAVNKKVQIFKNTEYYYEMKKFE